MAKKNELKIPEFVYSEEKRKEYENSFKSEKNDPEMIELAEEGLDDFEEIIERYENESKIK